MGQVWIVRSPFSEILTQVLLLAGIWTLSIGMTEKRKRFCILAGILFGLTLFVRIDSVLILAALLMFAWMILVLSEKGRSLDLPLPSFLMALAVVVAYASLHTAVFAYAYLDTVINTFKHFSPSAKPSLLIGGLVTVLLLVLWKRAGLVHPFARQQAFRTKFMVVLFTLFTALFIYAYFIRPLNPGTDRILLPPPLTGSVGFYDEIALVRLGWYVTPLGIVLAYLGSLISLKRLVKDGSVVLLPFVLILGVFALFYLYKSRAFPDNYWVIRRYVEIVIPGFLMLASLSLVSLFVASGANSPTGGGSGEGGTDAALKWPPTIRRWASLAICVGAFLVLVGGQLKASYPLLNQTEWENTFPQLENLAGANQEADVLLLERGQFQDFFSSPLKFIFHKTVYTFANNKPGVQAFDRLMDEWTQQGKRVNLLASEEQTELHSRKYRFVPKERFRFHTRVVEQTYERMPQSMEDLRFTVQIYKLERNLQQDDSDSIAVNIGYNFGFMTSGFYATELSSDYEPFRWSGAKSTLELPRIEAAHDAVLLLRLRQDFPRGIIPAPVRIFFNERLIDESKPSSKFEVIKCAVPRSLLNLGGKNKIAFSSSTFCPARLGGDDIRELGFMVHYIKLQSLTPITRYHPYSLDLGAESDVVDGQLTGFYGREPGSYRWTEPKAEVIVPRPLGPEPELEISLRAAKSSPDRNFKQFLTLSVNDVDVRETELLGTWDEFKVYHFRIPKSARGSPNTAIMVRAVPPWIPKSTDYYTDDWRTLGCAIDWLKIGAKAE
ncbi:MAG: hypothetical protein DMG05_23905 [Acidobacteria bacterium]|nr:MAG: hypothetical protein DMG05_23905 [Acidobacteriota bacterium]